MGLFLESQKNVITVKHFKLLIKDTKTLHNH